MRKVFTIIILLLFCGGICTILLFNSLQKKDEFKYNNDIFTKSQYNSLEKIIYGSHEFNQTNKKELEKVYSYLANAKLVKSKKTESKDEIKYGPIPMQVVSDEGIIVLSVTSNQVIINDVLYDINIDLVSLMNETIN